jgi:hypothetical protein
LDFEARGFAERGGVIDRAPDALEVTFEAVTYELRTYGTAALTRPDCRRRLGDLSSRQLDKVIAALIRLRGRSYCPGIDDRLFLALDGLRQ